MTQSDFDRQHGQRRIDPATVTVKPLNHDDEDVPRKRIVALAPLGSMAAAAKRGSVEGAKTRAAKKVVRNG
jgi:hypothetical protein